MDELTIQFDQQVLKGAMTSMTTAIMDHLAADQPGSITDRAAQASQFEEIATDMIQDALADVCHAELQRMQADPEVARRIVAASLRRKDSEPQNLETDPCA